MKMLVGSGDLVAALLRERDEARAALAASDATRALVDLALRLGLATGHGDTPQDVAGEIAGQVERERAALAAERERAEKAEAERKRWERIADLEHVRFGKLETAERALAEAREALVGARAIIFEAQTTGLDGAALARWTPTIAAIDRALAPAPPALYAGTLRESDRLQREREQEAARLAGAPAPPAEGSVVTPMGHVVNVRLDACPPAAGPAEESTPCPGAHECGADFLNPAGPAEEERR